jgi:hypothetical protein
MLGTINCVYETPCGWCSKWDKKCNKTCGNDNFPMPNITCNENTAKHIDDDPFNKIVNSIEKGVLPPIGSLSKQGLQTYG